MSEQQPTMIPVTQQPPDLRVFSMTKAEASHIGLLWPARMKALADFQALEDQCFDMKKELAERLSVVHGSTVTPEAIITMDWAKREARVDITKKPEVPPPPAAPQLAEG